MKAVATAGGIVATKFAAAGRWQTCAASPSYQTNVLTHLGGSGSERKKV